MNEREQFVEYLKVNNITCFVKSHMYTNYVDLFYVLPLVSLERINALLDLTNVYVVTDVKTYYLYKNSDYIEFERFTKGVSVGEYYRIKIYNDNRQYDVTDIIACYVRFFERI